MRSIDHIDFILMRTIFLYAVIFKKEHLFANI